MSAFVLNKIYVYNEYIPNVKITNSKLSLYLKYNTFHFLLMNCKIPLNLVIFSYFSLTFNLCKVGNICIFY